MTEYYKDNMEKGLQYMDWLQDKLRQYGIVLSFYSSRKYQYEKGESACGFEVKFDDLLRVTGNLYIETEEKTHPDVPEYSPSGIYRDDNTWLYLIGDYDQIFFFGKNHLRAMYENEEKHRAFGIRRVQTPTSKGFLLPATEKVKKQAAVKHIKF